MRIFQRLRDILILSGLLLALPALAQAVPTEASLRLIDQEQRRLVFENDAEGLARILHPNLLINGPMGRVVTRDGILESVRSGAIAKEKFERVPESVKITGSVGVLVGGETVVAAPGSRDFAVYGRTPFQRRYTNIFLFEGGRWLMLARQAGVVPKPQK